MVAVLFIVLTHQFLALALVQPNREFSQSTAVHSMTPTHSWAQILLVAVGVIAVVVTTTYALRCFLHPGEIGEGHIKRRILDEGCE